MKTVKSLLDFFPKDTIHICINYSVGQMEDFQKLKSIIFNVKLSFEELLYSYVISLQFDIW